MKRAVCAHCCTKQKREAQKEAAKQSVVCVCVEGEIEKSMKSQLRRGKKTLLKQDCNAHTEWKEEDEKKPQKPDELKCKSEQCDETL